MSNTDLGRADDKHRGELTVRTDLRDGNLAVEAVGVVTLSTAGALAGVLNRAIDDAAPDITVDLRAVHFMDNHGLSVLVGASRRLRTPQNPCAPRVLVAPGGQPERVLKLGNFGRILEIHAARPLLDHS